MGRVEGIFYGALVLDATLQLVGCHQGESAKGTNILSFVKMVVASLRHSIPKSSFTVKLVRRNTPCLTFFHGVGNKGAKEVGDIVGRGPAVTEPRICSCGKLEVYRVPSQRSFQLLGSSLRICSVVFFYSKNLEDE